MNEAKRDHLFVNDEVHEQLRMLADSVQQVRKELVSTKAELEKANAELKKSLVDGTIRVASAKKADSAKLANKAHASTMLEADAGHFLRFHQLTSESRRSFELYRWDGEWFSLVEVAFAGRDTDVFAAS
jgi:hypothetical protein